LRIDWLRVYWLRAYWLRVDVDGDEQAGGVPRFGRLLGDRLKGQVVVGHLHGLRFYQPDQYPGLPL
jgi:hypothetical protein